MLWNNGHFTERGFAFFVVVMFGMLTGIMVLIATRVGFSPAEAFAVTAIVLGFAHQGLFQSRQHIATIENQRAILHQLREIERRMNEFKNPRVDL